MKHYSVCEEKDVGLANTKMDVSLLRLNGRLENEDASKELLKERSGPRPGSRHKALRSTLIYVWSLLDLYTTFHIETCLTNFST